MQADGEEKLLSGEWGFQMRLSLMIVSGKPMVCDTNHPLYSHTQDAERGGMPGWVKWAQTCRRTSHASGIIPPPWFYATYSRGMPPSYFVPRPLCRCHYVMPRDVSVCSGNMEGADNFLAHAVAIILCKCSKCYYAIIAPSNFFCCFLQLQRFWKQWFPFILSSLP